MVSLFFFEAYSHIDEMSAIHSANSTRNAAVPRQIQRRPGVGNLLPQQRGITVQISSGTILMAPHGHSDAQTPQPLQ